MPSSSASSRRRRRSPSTGSYRRERRRSQSRKRSSSKRRSLTPRSPSRKRRSSSRRRSRSNRRPRESKRRSPSTRDKDRSRSRRRSPSPPLRNGSRGDNAESKEPPKEKDAIETCKAEVAEAGKRHSGDQLYQAEIYMSLGPGAGGSLGPGTGGRQRTMCIRGPCRVDRVQAQDDAEKLEHASKNGIKAVREAAAIMKRGRVATASF